MQISSTMAKCNACGKFLSPTGAASCTNCPCTFHRMCVAIPDNGAVPKNWVCPECKKKVSKCDNTETPVKGIGGNNSANNILLPSIPASLHSEGVPSLSTSADNEFQAMRREMAEYMLEIRSFRKEVAEFRSSIVGINQRLDLLEHRVVELQQRDVESRAKEISVLEQAVEQLKLELCDRDQEALLSDLDIGGLPEEKGENIMHTISTLATKLGVQLGERDIVFAERVGGSITTGDAVGVRRSRRIVVRLTRRQLRDDLLRAARVRRNFTASDMGLEGPSQRIYLNERLTRSNRILFHRVREECRKRNWRYAWTKKGRIYARQSDGSQAYTFRSDADISRVFVSVTV